jgi:hypothetical protein
MVPRAANLIPHFTNRTGVIARPDFAVNLFGHRNCVGLRCDAGKRSQAIIHCPRPEFAVNALDEALNHLEEKEDCALESLHTVLERH